jgi:glucuronoarabinoxylan endo-1,4-beta-xylanase
MSARILFISLSLVVLTCVCAFGATGSVNPDTRYQTIEGFGAAGAWYENWLTSHSEKEELYDLFFDDLGLDIYRIRNTYDYDSAYMNNTGNIVNEALERNPNLKIMISSWSPPTYLKSTGQLNSGTLIGGPSSYNYTGFALWWYNSLVSWSNYGVDADYISIQNEPDYNGNDRCLFTPSQTTTYAGYDQAFEAVWNKLNTQMGSSMPKMLGPETSGFYGASGYSLNQYISALINQSHVYGYAHHLYNINAGDDPDDYITAMTNFNSTWGSKPLFQTEYEKSTDSWPDALNLAHLIHNSLTVEEVSGYLYWDLFWDNGGLVMLENPWNQTTDEYWINSDYYGMKHFSAFIFPDWQRIYTTDSSSNLLMSAYISPDEEQMSVIIINKGSSTESLSLTITDYTIVSGSVYRTTSSQNCQNIGSYSGGSLSIPGQSITTLAITGTGDVTPPAAPTGLDATAQEHAVSLNWNDNSEPDLDGYNVYRSTTSGYGYSKINTSLVSTSDYVDNSVNDGTTYYYVVRAVDTAENESGNSSQDYATPYNLTPATPTGLSATEGSGAIWLDWDNNTEFDLAGYYVYRSNTSGGSYTRLNTTPITGSDYIDLDVTTGITYYYVVTAVDTSLESGNSAEVSGTPSGSGPTVYNFDGVTAANTNTNAYMCDVDVFPFLGLTGNRNTMVEATDEEYTYISADDGDVLYSATSGIGDEVFLWVEMQFFQAPEDIGRIDLTFKGSTVDTSNITHSIYVLKAGADWTLNDSWVQVGTSLDIPPGQDTTMIRSIESDFDTYIDASGNIVWGVFESEDNVQMRANYVAASVYSIDTPPAAPTGLIATGNDGSVSLDWDDNSESDLDGYNIYRSTTSGNGYSKINTPLIGVSQYTDNDVINGTTYYYVVTAVDISSVESSNSSEVSATPDIPSTDIELLGSWATGTSHTKETGSNRALIFIAHEESTTGDPALTSVTYGGQPMTKIIEISAVSGSYGNYVAAFMLDETGVAAASSSTFVPTWSASTSSVSYASAIFSNVDQSDSIGATASNGTTSGTDPILTSALATSDGDMVIDAATCGNLGSYTLLNGFTEGTDQSVGTSGHTGVTGYKLAAGADETPSADYSATVNRQVIIGFVLQAAAGMDEPPAAPTGLTAQAGNNLVLLEWDNNLEEDLAGYNVYRSVTSGSGHAKVNGTLVVDSNYLDTDVVNNQTYYYIVKAVDESSNESNASNEVSATPDYQTCADVQAADKGLVSDLTGDCYVDLEDLEMFAGYWLYTNCSALNDCEGADFVETDGDVDFEDYSDFAIDWFVCNNPGDANCINNWLND